MKTLQSRSALLNEFDEVNHEDSPEKSGQVPNKPGQGMRTT